MSTPTTRPTFPRHSSDYRSESAPEISRPSTPSNLRSVLPQDVWDPHAPASALRERPAFIRKVSDAFTLQKPLIAAGPEPTTTQRVRTGITANWRRAAAVGVVAAVIGWITWATTKIVEINSMPFCVSDPDHRG